MERKIANEVVAVIRSERQKRSDRLNDEDPDFAYDQWLFTDEPFINEMCLMMLLALRHQVERELIFLAARANVGPAITRQQYHQNVASRREEIKRRGWANLIATLNLGGFAEWDDSMETLRLLANCLKHEPTQEPDENLLRHLGLPLTPEGPMIVGYLPLPESRCFREGLAKSVNLSKDADYCAIAEAFVNSANRFLEHVRQEAALATVTGAVSLFEFAC